MMKRVFLIVLSVIFVVSLVSCSSDSDDAVAEYSGDRTVVNFLNWGDYIDTDTIAMFEEENPDIEIVMTTVPSNEEMYIVASTSGSQIDLITPSEYMTQKMINENLLAPIDTSVMENYKYVQDFAETYSYDGSLEYAVPYTWGTLGILYNKNMVDKPVDSWSVLFDEQYSGKIFMYDSIRDTFGAILKYLGYSLNTVNKDELQEATDLLVEQKPLVLAYGTDELRMSMVNESGAMAIMYAGDAVYAMQDNDNLEYAVPKEGSNIFVDNFCILKSTDVYDEALRFVDFLCRPDIAAINAEYIGYSCPVSGYEEYLDDDELLNNKGFNPDMSYLNTLDLEFYHDLGDDIHLYEDAWIELKAK